MAYASCLLSRIEGLFGCCLWRPSRPASSDSLVVCMLSALPQCCTVVCLHTTAGLQILAQHGDSHASVFCAPLLGVLPVMYCSTAQKACAL